MMKSTNNLYAYTLNETAMPISALHIPYLPECLDLMRFSIFSIRRSKSASSCRGGVPLPSPRSRLNDAVNKVARPTTSRKYKKYPVMAHHMATQGSFQPISACALPPRLHRTHMRRAFDRIRFAMMVARYYWPLQPCVVSRQDPAYP